MLSPEFRFTPTCARTVRGFASGFGLASAIESNTPITVRQIPLGNFMLIAIGVDSPC